MRQAAWLRARPSMTAETTTTVTVTSARDQSRPLPAAHPVRHQEAYRPANGPFGAVTTGFPPAEVPISLTR